MTPRPTLQDFVDDELLRAPLTLDQVVDAVVEQWRRTTPAASRMSADPVRVLTQHRSDLINDAVRELRTRARAELTGTPQAKAAPAAPAKLALALIGEDEVSVDVEVSRAVERVKSAAEFELRELQAFTSALVDDVNVARDTNPFRPESYVRSLWVGVSGVPMSRALQAAFMRDAATPLSKTLRQTYAAACTRLESQGVQPAAYRTIVLGATTRGGLDLPNYTTLNPQQLSELRHSMPMPLDEGPTLAALAGKPAAPQGVDPQLVELITRLFDAMQASKRLPAAAIPLVLRLQPAAMRAAVRDPAMLESYDHPVWRFMDQLGFMIEAAPAADAERCVAYCRQLVDHLASEDQATAARFEWGTGRLVAFERHVLDQGIAAAGTAIDRIRAEIGAAHQPIDVGTLDTVPAELLPDLPPPAPAPIALQPGDRLRAYLHGEWRRLQLLWCDPEADHWLLRDMATDQTWVLRQRALDRLVAERLARAYQPRSLVRDAANRVLQRLHVGA